ncbi:hypothetical protein ZYGR_0I07110 [Zygosaccharomyces rouxii]|uniref:ZYRO0C16808p n=2 Tax=Zygosaccharomyces rouxii TaxID=4956 RepID=C5DUH5_ZYGRC|nr:uncharacterized protein ZYRO0C16808g [Zygosaccharomyces rouxii]KAH9201394.1 hypothetical protein LQ764DRAFT_233209 [Zygosaccharomyces rouxii]GAV48414.1 hypothetical protein ZYGR_0I07110 [Zygosaccharomyces rouxii]CAR27436.1 ZYRO0C16808p [Zygosaccharomyces rouxii]
MSSSAAVRDSAKQILKIIEKLPDERIKHLVSFKDSQAERFRRVAGLQSTDKNEKKASLEDIKDIITRTSGPLGLQKDLLKKVQSALPQDELTEQSIQEQMRALSNISNNKFKNYYDVGEKLYKPAGNPIYYQRIMDEIQGKQKETFLSALRTVVFGK